MKLPDELRRVAAVGTGQIDHLPEIITAVDGILGKVDGNIEALVLLKAAGVALQRQAGYIARRDHRSLEPPCEPDERKPLNRKSADHLVLLLENNAYLQLLPEWCVHVALSRQRAPEELLPKLLHTGQRRENLRPYLGLLLGKRGKWLAEKITNQNWNWALEVDDSDPKAMLNMKRQSELPIIDALNTKTLDVVNPKGLQNQHDGLVRLVNFNALWSKTLARVFIAALDFANVTASPTPDTTLDKVLDRCGYYFPLSLAHMLLNLLSQGNEAWQTKTQSLQQLFELRRDMQQALYKSAEQNV